MLLTSVMYCSPSVTIFSFCFHLQFEHFIIFCLWRVYVIYLYGLCLLFSLLKLISVTVCKTPRWLQDGSACASHKLIHSLVSRLPAGWPRNKVSILWVVQENFIFSERNQTGLGPTQPACLSVRQVCTWSRGPGTQLIRFLVCGTQLVRPLQSKTGFVQFPPARVFCVCS